MPEFHGTVLTLNAKGQKSVLTDTSCLELFISKQYILQAKLLLRTVYIYQEEEAGMYEV